MKEENSVKNHFLFENQDSVLFKKSRDEKLLLYQGN